MAAEADLMLVLLALQMKFLKQDQVVEAGASWALDRTRRLTDILEEKGFLRKSTRELLEKLIAAHVEEVAGGDPGLSLAALSRGDDIRRSLLDLPLDEDVRESLIELTERLDSQESDSVVLTKPREERYRLGDEIGRGGLGRVVSALDTVLGREVAIKEMVMGTRSTRLLKRFLQEGEIAGKLSHPNVIPIHDIGVREEDGRSMPYFVMTLIVGRDLQELLESVELGEGRARLEYSRPRLLRIFQEVCLAVAYAHDHQIIHRDLKPANVMVGKYGEVYVVDWGLAKVKGLPDLPDGAPRPPDLPDVSPRQTDSPDQGAVRREGRKGALASPADQGDQSPAKRDLVGQEKWRLTTDGKILGTPAYMSPEQAGGRTGEIDERSDIYSLGCILYEILTFQPPFEGDTALNVIGMVVKGEWVTPSAKVAAVRMEAGLFPGSSDRVSVETGLPGGDAAGGGRQPRFAPDPVPPELDEIVVKAMARAKKDRFSTAMELHEEVQRFLEGEKERERNRQRAREKVEEGKALVRSLEKMRAELRSLRKKADEKATEIMPHWPVKKKTDFWELQDRIREMGREIVRRFSIAGTIFQAALSFERENREAREALADLYWDQYLREEEGGDVEEMVLYENLVREYNTGKYDDLLRGNGTLAVTTWSFPCQCLVRGRTVSPEELGGGETGSPGGSPSKKPPLEGEGPPEPDQVDQSAPKGHQVDQGIMGYHPFSGRALDGHKGAEGLRKNEPDGPIRLRVHGPDCRTEPMEGADVWLYRYEEHRRLLLPVFPKGVSRGRRSPSRGGEGPDPALDAALNVLFDPKSPFRPGEGMYLGKTPLTEFSIPMGSYLLILAGEGFRPVRVPVTIGRLAEEDVDVVLYRDVEIPDGFVQVPAGKFVFQGDRENPYSGPKETLETEDFFMAKFPITCREYLDFLNDLAATDPAAADGRVPRKAPTTGAYWPKDERGTYHIPTETWLARAPEALSVKAANLDMSPVGWEEDWPVFSVSWEDLITFAAWRSRRSGLLFSLPHEALWEKAARGTDGRLHPLGNDVEMDPTYSNASQSFEDAPRPCSVHSFPEDESPYGVKGMGGNSRDLCLNDPGEQYPGWRLSRGGNWQTSGLYNRSASRTGDATTIVFYNNGGRLAWYPRSRMS